MISISINAKSKEVIIKQNIGGTITLDIKNAKEFAFDLERKIEEYELKQINEKYK
jgi:hypothetical protein